MKIMLIKNVNIKYSMIQMSNSLDTCLWPLLPNFKHSRTTHRPRCCCSHNVSKEWNKIIVIL